MRSARTFALVTVALALMTFTLLGCEAEGEDVTVENRSNEIVVVFENDVPIALMHPRITQGFHILRFSGSFEYSVQSFDSREILAHRAFTWEEIVEEDGISIVIE